jgi:hypothetical protein
MNWGSGLVPDRDRYSLCLEVGLHGRHDLSPTVLDIAGELAVGIESFMDEGQLALLLVGRDLPGDP